MTNASLHRRLRCLFALGFVCALGGVPGFSTLARANGQTLPPQQAFDLHADEIEYERARNLYLARGRVVLREATRVLRADALRFDARTQRGEARGNVVLTQGESRLFADSLEFELGAATADAPALLTGRARAGRIETGASGLRISGAELQKLDARRYWIEDARITTCNCTPAGGGKEVKSDPRLPWQLRAERAELELGGYATLYNTRFELLGVPLLWLPGGVVKYPLKETRQTGLLQPGFRRSSRTGVDIDLPFFWAAHEQVNVLFTPHWLQKNGIKPEAQVEYVFGASSWGQLFGSFLADDDSVEPSQPATPFDDDRFAFAWRADHALGAGFRHKVNARVVSDNMYDFDFREFDGAWRDRFLEASTFIEKRFGPLQRDGLSLEVRYADDQSSPDNLDRDAFLLQRAPDLRIQAAPRAIGPLPAHLAGELRYTRFRPNGRDPALRAFGSGAEDRYLSRLDPRGLFFDTGPSARPSGQGDCEGVGAPGDGECDGRFQEGEPLADRGQRLLVAPRLLLPFQLFERFELLGELGYQGAFYDVRRAASESRGLWTGLFEVRTRLHKKLKLPFGGPAVRHLLEPGLRYTGVLKTGQRNNPLFAPRGAAPQWRLRQLEPGSVLHDPRDRVSHVSALTATLAQRVYQERLLADVTLSAHFDFGAEKLRTLAADGSLHFSPRWRGRFNAGFDFEASQLDEALFEVGYHDPQGNDFAFAWRRVERLPVFFEGSAQRPFSGERFRDHAPQFNKIRQLELLTRWAVAPRVTLRYRLVWSLEGSLTLTNHLGLEYRSKCDCFSLRAEARNDRGRGFEFSLRYTLLGLGGSEQSRRPRRGLDGFRE